MGLWHTDDSLATYDGLHNEIMAALRSGDSRSIISTPGFADKLNPRFRASLEWIVGDSIAGEGDTLPGLLAILARAMRSVDAELADQAKMVAEKIAHTHASYHEGERTE
jgi:hypothetical protein